MKIYVATLVLGLAAPAFADGTAKDKADSAKKDDKKAAVPAPFGAAKDSLICQDGIDRLGPNKCQPGYEPNLTPECKAESHKRIDECKKRPDDAKAEFDTCSKSFSFPEAAKDLEKYCGSAVWFQMSEQAKKAAIVMPVADTHDAKIEKAIGAAFTHEFPQNKIIKVVITNRDYEAETDAFSRVVGRDVAATVVNKHKDGTCELYSELWLQSGNGRSFSGPFSERGAGSLSKDEIDCALVK